MRITFMFHVFLSVSLQNPLNVNFLFDARIWNPDRSLNIHRDIIMLSRTSESQESLRLLC